MSDEQRPQSRYVHILPDGPVLRTGSRAEALALLADGGFVWFDFVDPARTELESLIKPLGLHPLSIEDCFD
jgi:Mg2+ and Co2+ transporter CorA